VLINGGKQTLVENTVLSWSKSEIELIAAVKDLLKQKLWLDQNNVEAFQIKLLMGYGSLSNALDLSEEVLFN
jgi:hypothetical protein